MNRTVTAVDGSPIGDVTLADPVIRQRTPLLTARDVNAAWKVGDHPKLAVVTIHNAGVTFVAGPDGAAGRFVMLFRSHLRDGRSVIGLATSPDGLKWKIHHQPVLGPVDVIGKPQVDAYAPGVNPTDITTWIAGGVEDPRINPVQTPDGLVHVITLSGYDRYVKDQVYVLLLTTTDFQTFTHHGRVSDRIMRNVVIFPESQADGRYVGLFRPNGGNVAALGAEFTKVVFGYAPHPTGPWALEDDDQPGIQPVAGPGAFADKIGPCTPPLLTGDGRRMIQIVHGVRGTMSGSRYVLGVVMHDPRDPQTLHMSSIPIMFPAARDCLAGAEDYVHVPWVIFSCGMVRLPDGTLYLYYGGFDTVMNLAVTHEDILVELCRRYPQQLVGRP